MPAADPVAVIGMGSAGTLLAGAGHPILACGRAPLASITVADDAGRTSHPVTWTDEPGDPRGIRWAVPATKIHDTAAVSDWLRYPGTRGRRHHEHSGATMSAVRPSRARNAQAGVLIVSECRHAHLE